MLADTYRMELPDLLVYLLIKNRDAGNPPPAKTKLLKLAYLVDLEYTRRQGSRLLDVDWIYYRFGPYVFSFDDIISHYPFRPEETEFDQDKIATIVCLESEASPPSLPFEARSAANSVLADFAKLSLNDILDHVYFETEPMQDVQDRGQKLNFDTVNPADHYKVRQLRLDPKTRRSLLAEFRKKVRDARASQGTT